MSWHSLGVVEASYEVWSPFLASSSSVEFFRITFASPLPLKKINGFAWLAFRFLGASEALPPLSIGKIYPSDRGNLLHLPFPKQMYLAGYNQRLFEVRKGQFDIINWTIQLEEMLINVSPGSGAVETVGLQTTASDAASVTVENTSILVRDTNVNRTCLYVINVGLNWVTINHQTPVTFGEGIMLSPKGGSYIIESGNLDKRAVYGICDIDKPTLLTVYEGLLE